jgi:cyclic-di-GMP-binding protein
MRLELSIPSHSTRLLGEVEQRPQKVAKWLAALPLLNVAETGHKLYATLQTYNRMDLDPERRLELLELYRDPIKHLGLALQKQYVGMPLPLPERNKNIAEQHREFHTELAYGYKQVVLAQSDARRPRNPAEARALALPLQRSIRHLSEVLLTSHLCYSPPPPSTWKEIHTLYRRAEQLNLTAVALDDDVRHLHGDSTVAKAYKHALLLDLSDPYHQSPHLIAKVDLYLERAADLATVQPAAVPIEVNCQFLIDLEGHCAGMVHSAEIVPDQLERYRVLNTFELARTIHAQLTQLHRGEALAAADLPPDLKDDGVEMLTRLINVWGVNPKRSFRRSERPDAKADVVIGLDAISYWVNGGHKLVPSVGTVGPASDRPSYGTFGNHQIGTASAPNYNCSAWTVEDESAGGMSLSKSGSVRGRVRVGDVIATRFSGEDNWTISAVRWVKSASPSNVEIGIQRLAPVAKAVMVKTVSGDTEESDFLPALQLPAIPALKEPDTLLVPAALLRSGRTFYVDDGQHLRRAVAHQILEAASGFDRIEFTIDAV